MSKYATKENFHRVLSWVAWFIVVAAALTLAVSSETPPPAAPVLGVATHDAEQSGPLFPWQSRYRWKKWALQRYRKWRQAYRKAKRTARLARLALAAVTNMAALVDLLTAYQLRYKLGLLPVLYALLQTLEVEAIINRYAPTQSKVSHGVVALVLVLNRLVLPLPLYQIADWVGQTYLAATLGVAPSTFNDDRLSRTLDAIYPHLESIWNEILARALVKTGLDLSVIFYDVTAAIAHGRYVDSQVVDFGFAHNTPQGKRKFKIGLNVSQDGGIPLLHRLLPGSAADQATVAQNLENLAAWLQRQGYLAHDSLIVGDRAMLNAELALRYQAHGLRFLAGLRVSTPEQQRLLTGWSDEQMQALPLEAGPSPQYWGRLGQVTLTHQEKRLPLRALVVLAGPLRDEWRASRTQAFEALFAELEGLRSKLGQPRYRTLKAVQRSVNARLKRSKVGGLVNVSVYLTSDQQVNLHWEIDQAKLTAQERRDGRYLLVTNDWTLSAQEMFRLYRAKDGVEKCFQITKQDLKVSPIYLHKDRRIASMLFINMVALLTYTLLQRQMREQGVSMTTRALIRRLDQLTLIETHCRDGSILRRLTPVDAELAALLELVGAALNELMQRVSAPVRQPLLLPDLETDRASPSASLC